MKLEYNKETGRYNDFHCGANFKIKIVYINENIEAGLL